MKEHFEKFLGLGNATDNPNDLAAYSYDASELSGTCRAVLFPSTEEQLRLIITYCNRTNIDLVLRGNGSNTTGMAVPNNAVVVSTQGFSRIHTLSVSEGWVRTDCGITIAELNDALKEHGVRYPLEGSRDHLMTVGGLLATNGPGRYSGKYGLPAETVLEIEAMDGTGKHYTFTKDFTEHCGNEGSVFALIRAKLAVIPRKDRSADLEHFDTIQQAVERSQELRKDVRVIAVDLFDAAAATYAGLNTRPTLLVEREGTSGSHAHERYASLLSKRNNLRRLLGAKGHTLVGDGLVDAATLVEAVEWCKANDLPVVCHALSGVVHPFFRRDQAKLRDQWAAFLLERGQSVAGQYGYGLVHKHRVPQTLKTKIRMLKERYDYTNILGRGKLYDYI